jgi:hypothetical protein
MSRPAFTMTNLLNLTRTTLYSPVAGTGRLVAAGRGARPAEDVARHRNVDVVFRFARDSPLEESGLVPVDRQRPRAWNYPAQRSRLRGVALELRLIFGRLSSGKACDKPGAGRPGSKSPTMGGRARNHRCTRASLLRA